MPNSAPQSLTDSDIELLRHNWSGLLYEKTHRMEIQYNPAIGHMRVPNMRARLPSSDGAYFSVTNSWGFRSHQEYKKKRGNRRRILFFGDSYTEGQGCNNNERFSEQLGELLDAEVYNFGLSGTGPDQHLLIYQEFAKDIDADLAIWGIPAHNIERIQMKYRPSLDRMTGLPILMPKPYFTLEDGQLELHHVPAPRERPKSPMNEGDQFSNPGKQVHQSRPIKILKRIVDQLHLKDHIRGLFFRIAGVQMYDQYTPDDPAWQLMAAIVRRFAEVCHVPLLVVPLPTHHYYVDKLEPVYDRMFESLANPDLDLHVYGLSRDLVAGKSIQQRLQISYQSEGHYGQYGNQEVAKQLARRIPELGLWTTIGTHSHPPRPQAASTKLNYVLGIAQLEQDAGVVLLRDGQCIAAGREEHFTQRAGQGGFPKLAVNFCLEEADIKLDELAVVAAVGVTKKDISDAILFTGQVAIVDPTGSDAVQLALAGAIKEAGDCDLDNTHVLPGAGFTDEEVGAFLGTYGLPATAVSPTERVHQFCIAIQQGETVAHFSGPMEHHGGPFAGRGIFAQAGVLEEDLTTDHFPFPEMSNRQGLIDTSGFRPYLETLVEARVKSISYSLLAVNSQPVALTPYDAYRVMMMRQIDTILLGGYLLRLKDQPPWTRD